MGADLLGDITCSTIHTNVSKQQIVVIRKQFMPEDLKRSFYIHCMDDSSQQLDIYLSVAVRYLPNDLGLLITDGCHYRKDQPIKCKWTEVVGQLATDVQTMDVSNTCTESIH